MSFSFPSFLPFFLPPLLGRLGSSDCLTHTHTHTHDDDFPPHPHTPKVGKSNSEFFPPLRTFSLFHSEKRRKKFSSLKCVTTHGVNHRRRLAFLLLTLFFSFSLSFLLSLPLRNWRDARDSWLRTNVSVLGPHERKMVLQKLIFFTEIAAGFFYRSNLALEQKFI